jgi:hypothetical protein
MMILATQVSVVVAAVVATIWVGLVYETVALRTNKVPTITDIINSTPRVVRIVFVALVAVGWLVWGAFHFNTM